MKKFMLLILVLWSFSANAQVELYNVGESGPSVNLTISPVLLITGGMVINGRWGLNIGTNFPNQTNNSISPSPRIFAIGGSYALKKSQSITKTFSLPLSVSYVSNSKESALSFGLTFANKVKINEFVYFIPSTTIIGNRFYSDNRGNQSGFGLSTGFSLQFIRSVIGVSYNYTNGSPQSGSSLFWGLSIGFTLGNNKTISNEN